MVRTKFASLSTEQFRLKMRPYAIKIYEGIFPGCKFVDLREKYGKDGHILDQSFAIDAILNMPSGQYFTIQEKYREHQYLRWGDFTQEYKNAEGTQFESPGEFFHLAAQLYFYGWANTAMDGFAKWIILDIIKYKLLIEQAGGINNLGKKMYNKKFGRASFFSIPLETIQTAIIQYSCLD